MSSPILRLLAIPLILAACADPSAWSDPAPASVFHTWDFVDGDDAERPPPGDTLTLVGPAELVLGAEATWSVSGAHPGEMVYLAYGDALGAGPCIPQAGGLCLDITAPIGLLAQGYADDFGAVDLSVAVPADLGVRDVAAQAVVVRSLGGADSLASEPWAGTTVEALPPVDAGNGAMCSGGGDAIVASDALLPAGSEPRTLELWLQTTAGFSEQYFLSYGTWNWSSGVYIGTLWGPPVVTQVGASIQGSTNISDGAWHHVAVTYDGSTYTMYVDGVAESSGAMGTTTELGQLVVCNTAPGPMGGIGGKPGVGSVDEVRIWDHARTEAEVVQSMTTSLLGDEPGLVLYYDMDVEGLGAGVAVPNLATATGSALDGLTQGTSTTPSFGPSEAF